MNKRRISGEERSLLNQIGASQARLLAAEEKVLCQEQSGTAPKALDVWFAAYQAKQKPRQTTRLQWNIASKALVTVCLVFAILSIMVFSVDAWRIRLFNMVIENKKTHSEITFTEKSDNEYDAIPMEWNSFYYPSILPEGYIIKSTHSLTNSNIIVFKNKEKQIQFITADFGYNFQLDTEDAVTTDITVKEDKGILIKKGDRSTIMWSNYDTIFLIISEDKEANIKQIAENIEKVVR